jgi:osmotically-inducible protein OsmY
MTDKDLKHNVQTALDWEPSVNPSDVAIAVDGGVVTLRGNVSSYAQKVAAERTALRVYGVKGVANDLDVRLVQDAERTDTEIAQGAVAAIEWNTMVPKNSVTVSVADHWVTLNGTVDWQFQRDAAVKAVRDLIGVKGVANNVAIKSRVDASDVRDKIEAAFKRSAEIDARRISVAATGSKVVLSGQVRSWEERREAERAAWAAPGVSYVDDRLTITP